MFFSGKNHKEQKIEQLLLENYNKYYRLAYSYVHHEADAADIVQNGAYKAIKNSDALKQEEYAQTWIYRIMLNEIFGYVKKNREVSLDEMPAEEGREDRYENIDLRRALDAMEERDKAVIELRYFEGEPEYGKEPAVPWIKEATAGTYGYMAVGIEERMVPHMENKKQDCKKIEELKRQYAGSEMSGEQVEQMKKRIEEAKMEKRNESRKMHTVRNIVAAAAAVAAVFVVLPNTSGSVAYAMGNLPVVGKLVEAVTFRNYQYDNGGHAADIKTPELTVKESDTEQMTDTEVQVQENLKKTTAEINAEIEKITDQIVSEFEESRKEEEGYQEVVVKHEVISTTDDYFTLKLMCYQAAGSGAEWDYYYTIDLKTGERLTLSDLFQSGADYITPISENIKEQMQQQMAEDDGKMYWVDNAEGPEWNFDKITDETSFYLDSDGHLVICFNEGDVAPMYMGCVQFVIPDEVVADIRK